MSDTKEVPRYSHEEWLAEGKRRFGDDFTTWKFECPICGHVAAVGDYRQYKERGADPNSATSECIGRYQGVHGFQKSGEGPCDYAIYGLFQIPGAIVTTPEGKEFKSFAFAEAA
jgi:hypothetical protein